MGSVFTDYSSEIPITGLYKQINYQFLGNQKRLP
nr:MAG TPA: hypothetical protein [Caudoviricetes sp.]